MLGAEATEGEFKNRAKDYDIIHLAMHANTNDLDPDYSHLIFSDFGSHEENSEGNDGFLHAYEVRQLRLHAQLVVLSACNTGAGKYVQGEGVIQFSNTSASFENCSRFFINP